MGAGQRGTAMMVQKLRAVPHLNAADNVAFSLRCGAAPGPSRQKAMYMLALST